MEYKIITDHYEESFQENVNREIKKGWKLLGGVAISRDKRHGDRGLMFAQAVTKE